MRKIKLSRHAKRRAKLYRIPEEIILSILRTVPQVPGKNEVIKKLDDFKYPIKIVYFIEEDNLFVILNYPLKKEKKK
jgi:hypothetical protein